MPASGMGTERSSFSYWRLAGLAPADILASSSNSAWKSWGVADKVSAVSL